MHNFAELIDAQLLVAETLDHRYQGKKFEHIKAMPAKQKGKRMEEIVAQVYLKLDHQVQKPQSTDYDLLINGKPCEITGATQVKGGDHFSFLQIRPLQQYDILVFAMFYPEQLVVMEMTKQRVLELIANRTFRKQHGGNSAESGTYCYYGTPESLAQLGATYLEAAHGI